MRTQEYNMDGEHINVLKSIDNQLTWLLVLVGSAVLAYLLRNVMRLKHRLPEVLDKNFENDAERYFEEGRLHALIELCERRLRSRPNSPQALWWCARAHYELRHYAIAEERFSKLSKIEPGWQEHVSPYLRQLDGKSQTVQ